MLPSPSSPDNWSCPAIKGDVDAFLLGIGPNESLSCSPGEAANHQGIPRVHLHLRPFGLSSVASSEANGTAAKVKTTG